ncbi:hypothetical protein CONLIGDRAFT_629597 [Coniochaeta ligniaria NRRL 30616]|uniref:Uncharacterized protein n=1 Tax=Coniochaeta ligniaria NRRL 30616 TaxID=1408157 RepID=A0A1J7JVX1_9PEZI|nr:hypothetical protein CONLIGDRAFT_629597 [Coniochaeta ligniaria NRRL 30616]
MPKDKKVTRDGSAAAKIKDSRFANFETDPRFRLPSKKQTKTTIDKRFSRMLKDDDFVATAQVDRYGRKLKTDSKKKALERLYQEEDEEDKGKGAAGLELDDDDLVQRELRAADDKLVQRQLREEDESYDPARGGGFSSSDDDSEEEEEEEDDDAAAVSAGPGTLREKDEVQTGEITNRVAVVNLDWDHIKSVDLFALFSSFVPLGGSIRKVSIYPSEFGKSRMQKEELEGPPKELFQKKATDEDEFGGFDSEDEEDESEGGDDAEDSDEEVKNELIQEGDDADFDSDALRTYQLDRLRYYYAVMICSDPQTAHKIYEATDGSEYLSSSNFLDLRFIPDDVTFDDEPRDECDSVPQGYKPVDFVTDALQHSKVKLTWDMHPEENSRKETISKAFSGSRAEIAENDLKAYLASDSEDEEEEEDAAAAGDGPEEPQLSKKELARRKMRAALGLSEEPAPKASKSAPVGDMEITFSSALSGKDSDKKDPEEETTLEKYKRKEKERKAKRKEMALAKREGGDKKAEATEEEDEQSAEEDLGFNDPFFTSEDPTKDVKKSSIRKEERKKKRELKEAEAAKNAAEKAQLELLMAGNTSEEVEHLDHFDMNEIMRAEKQKNKKNKKAKKAKESRGGLQEDFEMPVDDPRFKAVFESHEFAIDPSNPKFKATGAMKKILEEGRKKRKAGDVEEDGDTQQKSSKKSKPKHGDELSSLVEAVKKKAGGK